MTVKDKESKKETKIVCSNSKLVVVSNSKQLNLVYILKDRK